MSETATNTPDLLTRRIEPRTGGAPLLGDLKWATVRETAALLTYAQAVHVARTILDDVKAGRLTKPYSESVRMSLQTAAARIAAEAGT